MPDPIKQEDGSFLNEAGVVVNETGHLIDDDGALINEEGFLVNETGQLLNAEGAAVDAEGNLIDADNKLIESDDDPMIPKSRYDSAARRAKTAEDALAKTQRELEQVNKTTDTTGGDPKTVADFEAKIDEIDTKIEEARKDGDTDAVVRLNKEQRTYERSMYSQIAREEATGAGNAAQQAVAFDTLVDKLEQDYPVFNQDSKDFDQDLVNEVLDMHEAFVAKGDAPAVAMAKAVGYILPPKETSNKRNTDTAKNLDAAKRQAPGMGGTGAGSDAGGDSGDGGDVGGMTQKEFDAMPDETKKRLRGDSYSG